MDDDHRHMAHALALARRGLGRVAPNPAVGCVLVNDGHIVGRGHTQPGGRPHAETVALAQAGAMAQGATAYVTLEPCAHHGQTPPCADTLIAAGITRAVIAVQDPDPRTAGRGTAKLEAAGIQVRYGVSEAEARRLNVGFFLKVLEKRPLVTAKIATTLDGKIATVTGESQWITGPQARRRAHLIRARHDAVLTGIGTVLADDPLLTVRLEGVSHQPVRIVLDRQGRLPVDSALVQSADQVPLWVIGEQPLSLPNIKYIKINNTNNIKSILQVLSEHGITRLMVEGGAQVLASFFAADLVDCIAWFRAPSVIGADGLSAVASMSIEEIAGLHRFVRVKTHELGEDRLELYDRLA